MTRKRGTSSGFLQLLKEEPQWWLGPILIAVLAIGAYVVFGGGTETASLDYGLF